jgi:hypothetical protein
MSEINETSSTPEPANIVRIVCVKVHCCAKCPFIGWEEDREPMGGNGWPFCPKLNKRLDSAKYKKRVDPDCKLQNAHRDTLKTLFQKMLK